MSWLSRYVPRLWPLVLVGAVGFLFWCDRERLLRIDYVSGLVGHLTQNDNADKKSLTGYAGDLRQLIIPGRNERSFDWIAQTQHMFAHDQSRVRWVAYDNAPQGRAVDCPSPYRWWLGLLAYIDYKISGEPLGLSTEHTARWADPALHVLLLIVGTCFVAWQFGGISAALFSTGIVAFFPLAGEFLPGMPDDRGLSLALLIATLLSLLAAVTKLSSAKGQINGPRAGSRHRGFFILAGVLGGLAVWVNLPAFAPLVIGVFAGGLYIEWIGRHQAPGHQNIFPWRVWSTSGGITLLAAFLAEYFPDHMELQRLEVLNPLYGLVWIALGELGGLVANKFRLGKFWVNPRERVTAVLAAAVVGILPIAMWKTGSPGIFVQATTSVRLTTLLDGAYAPNLWTWLVHERADTAIWAALLPLLALLPAGWFLFNTKESTTSRGSVVLMPGPGLILVVFGCFQLGMWSSVGAACLVLLVVLSAFARGLAWPALIVAAAAITGIYRAMPPRFRGDETTLTPLESQELIERHLAHWLTKRTGETGSVVYAPPHVTTTLCYFGGLRGIGTFAAENRAGFGATLMIAAMKTMEEAQGLLAARGVKYVIIPSWDPFFDEFAGRYLAKNYSNRSSLLARELRQWNLPAWLRPIPYQIPVGGGFEGQSALVFEVVDEQSPPVAASRLAEYLVELGELDRAAASAEMLRRFPGDVGALVARAQVQSARQDAGGFSETLASLQTRLSAGGDRFLPWDRRVSLAIVLAKGNQVELSREQLRRCLAEISEAKLRSLTTASLYGMQVLGKAFEFNIADPRLQALALILLPEDLRERI